MNCSVFCRILEEAREPGSPAVARRAELEDHARACDECATLLAAEDRLHASLASLRESSRVVPFGFEARVKRAVREQEAARSRSVARARWPVFASALASAIALGAIVTITLRDAPRVPHLSSIRSISADGRTMQAGALDDVTPVLFSDGRLEVTTSQPAATPVAVAPPPATTTAPAAGVVAPAAGVVPPNAGVVPPNAGVVPPNAGVVLVEWEL